MADEHEPRRLEPLDLPAFPRPESPSSPPGSTESPRTTTPPRRQTRRRSAGWRRFLLEKSGGRVGVTRGGAEPDRSELIARIRRPLAGCHRIAVVSRKGGVGKTTTTLALGHTFAEQRADRVIAVDANPDAGSLAYRVPRETVNTISTLLAARDAVRRYADVRAFTSQAATGLEVLAADEDPRSSSELGEADFRVVAGMLEAHYSLVCIDTGTGVLEPASRGIFDLAGQLVLVTAIGLDGGASAGATLDWLERNGHERLVAGAVAVINAVRPGGPDADLEQVERRLGARCRSVVSMPWDPLLAAGAEAALTALRPQTRGAWLELAARVADGFPEPPSRTR